MFEGLRSAFSDAAKSLGGTKLKRKDIETAIEQLAMSLLGSDVAFEVVEDIKSDLKKKMEGYERKPEGDLARVSLDGIIRELFEGIRPVDLQSAISEKKGAGEPYVIVFVGINGTGKTTTLAKVARLLSDSGFTVVVAAADTFRAGAIEQLREHTDRLGLKLVAQNYGADPAAVARDAVLYAKSHRTECVLIDTAGRMQTSSNLMAQIKKITDVIKPDLKIFVGDALAGNNTLSQARAFYEHVGFDCSILAKADADARGGAALSIARITSTPVIYVGTGQEYTDLEPFSTDAFLERILGGSEGAIDADIERYAAIYGAPPAGKEASLVKEWVDAGRPDPGLTKTKKKRKLFGRR